ncbi:hypothetical protein MKY48_17975 [Paenibacillus sp. FSL W8-0187]|uniref:hypothetical protein n=1 Tax=unclassified Paenibacillus TaxID=185978 RepID=UPI0030D9FD22
MPEYYGAWSTVYSRFRRWGKSGIFDRMLAVLAADPDDKYVILDSSIVCVHQHGTGAKGGSNSKRSVDQEKSSWRIADMILIKPSFQVRRNRTTRTTDWWL